MLIVWIDNLSIPHKLLSVDSYEIPIMISQHWLAKIVDAKWHICQ